jgi:ferritin-like metal-binding protein YciE
MKALKALFLNELATRFDSELQQVGRMAGIAIATTCPHLRQLFHAHHVETVGHVEKLGLVFKALGEEARGTVCEITAKLLHACEQTATEQHSSPGLNAALIACAQKIEHQEIASYGCLRDWAVLLGSTEASILLEALLDQEKAASLALSELAQSRCNQEAMAKIERTFTTSDRFGHEIVKYAA